MKSEVYVAFGANLGNREETIKRAMNMIAEIVGEVVRMSSIHESEPLVIPENPDLIQPSFLNGVILVETEMAPEDVLVSLLRIEEQLGRKRDQDAIRWGPRTIDLDVVAFDNEVISSETLTVPHPEMHNRRFVLDPMAEIAPGWIHPTLHMRIDELIALLNK